MTSPTPPIYNGRYELQNQVARGGTAQVYLARDLLLGRPVALKVLFPELSTDHTFVDRFRREAQAAANLSHPNIVPVFDWGESDNTYFIVMEYVDGEALSSIIRTEAPLDPAQAAQIAADIAKALAYAHRHSVVHRDVKPGNVLITSDGQVKVTDFGIARAIGADEQVTQTGLVMGTATYFSPEQAQGLGVDGRSDIYSLGVVLFEMCCGRPPFSGESPVSIAYKHVQEIPPTPRSVNPDIPAALEAIILQAMAKLPAERYQSADDLRADLDRFVRGQTVLAHPPTGTPSGNTTQLIGGLGGANGRMDTTAIPPAGSPAPPRSHAKRTTPYWIAAAVALLMAIAAVVVLGGRALGYFGGAKFATIPKVTGLKTSDALAKLRSAGFDPKTHTVTGNITNAGTVLSERPGFPNTARQGTTIELTVAGNIVTVKVPKVIGLSQADATTRLTRAGFQVGTPTFVQATDPSQQQGEVLAQNPTGGKKAPKGYTVQITIVSGQRQIKIPTSIIGQSEVSAVAALIKAGLSIGTTHAKLSATIPAGSVIDSYPMAAGSQVLVGTAVNLYISLGPPIKVPSVIDLTEADASTAINGAGLVVGSVTTQPVSSAALAGVVLTQSPAAGHQLAQGKPVNLVIGTFTNTGTSTTTAVPTSTTLGNTGTAPGT